MSQKRKRRTKKNIRPILLLLIFCILFIGGLCLALQKPTPVYADSLNFFVGEDLHLSDIIVDVENGVLLDSRKGARKAFQNSRDKLTSLLISSNKVAFPYEIETLAEVVHLLPEPIEHLT
jgi:hypothetical protein